MREVRLQLCFSDCCLLPYRQAFGEKCVKAWHQYLHAALVSLQKPEARSLIFGFFLEVFEQQRKVWRYCASVGCKRIAAEQLEGCMYAVRRCCFQGAGHHQRIGWARLLDDKQFFSLGVLPNMEPALAIWHSRVCSCKQPVAARGDEVSQCTPSVPFPRVN